MELPALSDLLGQDLPFVQRVLDSLDDPIFVKDRQHRLIVINAAFCRLLGLPHDTILGKSDPDFVPPEQAAEFWRLDDQLFESGEGNENEELLTDEEGRVHTLWTRKYPVREGDEIVGLVGIISDISSLRERLESVDKLERVAAQQRARIAAHQDLIDSMEAPIITVWEGILLVPLIGELSERRAALVLERLLDMISRHSTRVVFLDISGLATVGSSSATKLLEAVAAARLLGAQAEIVGVSPAIARLMIEQGTDFAHVKTHSNLHEGLRAALVRAQS